MKHFSKLAIVIAIVFALCSSSAFAQCFGGSCFGGNCFGGSCYSGNCYGGYSYSQNASFGSACYGGACRSYGSYRTTSREYAPGLATRSRAVCRSGSCRSIATTVSAPAPCASVETTVCNPCGQVVQTTEAETELLACNPCPCDPCECVNCPGKVKIETTATPCGACETVNPCEKVETVTETETEETTEAVPACGACETTCETKETTEPLPPCGAVKTTCETTCGSSRVATCRGGFCPLGGVVKTTVAETYLAAANAVRALRGLAPLAYDPNLDAGCENHARSMARFGGLFHAGGVAEICAQNNGSGIDYALNQWEHSAGHASILFNARYTRAGVAAYRDAYGRNWCVMRFQ